MPGFRIISSILVLGLCPFGVCQDPCPSDRADTVKAWLAIAGIKAEIQDKGSICQEAASFGGPGAGVKCLMSGNDAPSDGKLAGQEMPSLRERFLRFPQFKAEFLRTPNYVYGIPEGSPAGTTPQVYPNPDHGLLSVGGSLDFGELFPDAGKIMTACDSRLALLDQKEIATKHGRCDDSRYLNDERKGNWFRRYASASVINVNVSEVPRYESGIIISSASSSKFYWSFSVTGSVSPSALFETSAQRKLYAGYYSKYHDDLKNLGSGESIEIQDSCATSNRQLTPDCFKALATSTRSKRILLAILPKIDVKAYTVFDLAKTGSNIFIALPGSNKTIYDVTATWDFRSTVASIQMRSDAIAVYKDTRDKDKAAELKDANKKAKEVLASDFVSLSNSLDSRTPLCAKEAWWSDFRDHFTTFIATKSSSDKK